MLERGLLFMHMICIHLSLRPLRPQQWPPKPLPPKPLSVGGGAIVTLWITTDLGTHHALPVAADSTISDLKSQVSREHFAAFRKLGSVVVKSFQKEVFPQEEVMKGKKKKGIMYHLCDSFLRSDVLNGKTGMHELHVKMAAAGKHSGFDPQRHAQVEAVKARNGMAPAAAATDMHHAGHPLPRNAPTEFVKKIMCEVCKVQLNGPADIPRHVSGKNHKKKLNDSITPNPENPPNGAVGESTVPAAAVADGVIPAVVLEAGAAQDELKVCTVSNVAVGASTAPAAAVADGMIPAVQPKKRKGPRSNPRRHGGKKRGDCLRLE